MPEKTIIEESKLKKAKAIARKRGLAVTWGEVRKEIDAGGKTRYGERRLASRFEHWLTRRRAGYAE